LYPEPVPYRDTNFLCKTSLTPPVMSRIKRWRSGRHPDIQYVERTAARSPVLVPDTPHCFFLFFFPSIYLILGRYWSLPYRAHFYTFPLISPFPPRDLRFPAAPTRPKDVPPPMIFVSYFPFLPFSPFRRGVVFGFLPPQRPEAYFSRTPASSDALRLPGLPLISFFSSQDPLLPLDRLSRAPVLFSGR